MSTPTTETAPAPDGPDMSGQPAESAPKCPRNIGAPSSKRAPAPDALRYERGLTLYACRLLGGDVERARDVVQDAFARLHVEAPTGGLNGSLATWLYTVCRNRALDVRRKERRMRVLTDTDATDDALPGLAPDPAETAEQRETTGRVLRLLDQLPPNQQEVLRLKFQHGLTYRQIAAVTGLSESNVGFLLHTGLKTLRERLTP